MDAQACVDGSAATLVPEWCASDSDPMASNDVITLRGRRLVAGSLDDPSRPRVAPARQLAATALMLATAALALSLAAAPLVVHGWMLIWPLLAACAGVASGYRFQRARERAAEGATHPPLPPSAIVGHPIGPVLAAFGRIGFGAVSLAVVIAAAGHGSSPARAFAVSILPALFGLSLGGIVLAWACVIRDEQTRGERIYQSVASFAGTKTGTPSLYVVTGSDG
jgi:hypothetical protein